jgi:hypothetical protein
MAAPPVQHVRPITCNTSISYFWNPSTTTTEYVSSFNLTITGPSVNSNIALPPSARFYTVSGLSTSSNYSGNVYLTNISNVISPAVDFRTVTTGSRPSAPQNVTASYVGSNRLFIQWSTPTSDGGTPIRNYLVKTEQNSNIRIPARFYQNSVITPILSTGTYTFSVQAINDAGYSSKANTASLAVPRLAIQPSIYFNYENTLNDVYGNYTGTVYNGATYNRSSIVGLSSLSLNGSSQYMSFAGPTLNYSTFTFSGWLLYRQRNNWERFFDIGCNTSAYLFLTPYSGFYGTARFAITAGAGEQVMDPGFFTQTDVWTHYAITLNGTQGRMYRNGIAIASNNSMTISPYNVNATTNWLGRSFYGGDAYLNANIDEIGFYSTVLDASTIQLIYDNQVFSSNALNALNVYDTIVTSSITQWYDPVLRTSYLGTGATLYNTGPNNTNLTLGGSYSNSSGFGMRLSNTSASSNANTSYVQTSDNVNSFRTISMWYKVESVPTTAYLLDARTGVTGGDIVGNATNVTVGSYWSNATVYSNGTAGVNISSLQNSLLTVGGWRNYTFVATTSGTDNINFFSANNNTAGADVTFGPILIYNRALSQAENAQNYNRYKSRYGL